MPGAATGGSMRAKLDVDDLLKIVLVLVAIWLGLSIVSKTIDAFTDILGPASDVIGLVVLLLLVLWLLDKL